MTDLEDKDPGDPAPVPAPVQMRKFLAVVDGTPEAEVALHFASRRAKHTGGGVTLLAVLEPGDFQHWLGVKNIMMEEARAEAENLLHRLAAQVNDYAGITPELVIREGKRPEQIKQLIEEDHAIAVLVLGAGTGTEGPGPLVTLVAGGGDEAFRIPVTIVPGSLTQEEVHALA